MLYRVIEGHLESFLNEADAAGKNLPAFVQKAFWDYLDCGILERGFAIRAPRPLNPRERGQAPFRIPRGATSFVSRAESQ